MKTALFDCVHTHLTEALSLEHSHDRKSYIIRLFRKNTGHTPTEYVNSMRIEPAKDLLQTKSITDAAFVCGFNNLSYFLKVFRQYTGETRIQ